MEAVKRQDEPDAVGGGFTPLSYHSDMYGWIWNFYG